MCDFNIRIIAPPEPTVEVLGAPDLFVNRASMINLTCVVHHAPVPPDSITWYHNNKVRQSTINIQAGWMHLFSVARGIDTILSTNF